MVKVAVVTGSNKGIGFAIVKGLLQQKFDGDVFLTSRSEERGLEAVEKLKKVRISFQLHLNLTIRVKGRFQLSKIISKTDFAIFENHIGNVASRLALTNKPTMQWIVT